MQNLDLFFWKLQKYIKFRGCAYIVEGGGRINVEYDLVSNKGCSKTCQQIMSDDVEQDTRECMFAMAQWIVATLCGL